MTSQFDTISEIGERLKSYRIGKGLTPDDIAKKTGVSRAAIYRYESGQPIRVDVLGKIADLLGVSLTSLLGVGSEYISSALTFFERMRQIERTADQISVLFGPVSYLLTTSEFDKNLSAVLHESVPKNAANRSALETQINQIIDILADRKATYLARRPSIVSLVAASELEQFLRYGFVGKLHTNGKILEERRKIARIEVENIIEQLRNPPIGVQIGVVVDSMPGSSFQIFRKGNDAQVAVSPFRLGAFPNIRIGVATITSAKEAVELHQDVTERLWRNSLKGQDAIACLNGLLLMETTV